MDQTDVERWVDNQRLEARVRGQMMADMDLSTKNWRPHMSYISPADETLDSAKNHVRIAVSLLSQVVIDECSGHENLSSEFRATLRECLDALLDVRQKLRGEQA